MCRYTLQPSPIASVHPPVSAVLFFGARAQVQKSVVQRVAIDVINHLGPFPCNQSQSNSVSANEPILAKVYQPISCALHHMSSYFPYISRPEYTMTTIGSEMRSWAVFPCQNT